MDVSKLKDGDYAGICALQGCFGFVAVTKRNGQNYVVMRNKEAERPEMINYDAKEQERDAVLVKEEQLRLRVEVEFTDMKDTARFFYQKGRDWQKIGPDHKLYFKLDHFTGCRFGLFLYSTEETGGRAGFQDFVYTELE